MIRKILIALTLGAATVGIMGAGTASAFVAATSNTFEASFSTHEACVENGKAGKGTHWDGWYCVPNDHGGHDLYVQGRR